MARNVIGIDFGHCETAAAQPQKNNSGVNEVKTLNTNEGNVQVGQSQIIITYEQMKRLKGIDHPSYDQLKQIGPFRIGDLSAYVPDGERFFYFKVPPKDFDKSCGLTDEAKANGLTHGTVMACYVHALVDNIFKYNSGNLKELDRPESVLLVGCPATSDWTDEAAKDAYADLIQTATGVAQVTIVPESRAAMFSSVEGGVTNVSAMQGAAVFDFGSSTADCTYMLLGRKILEFSWSLGASEVERQMTKEALSSAFRQFGSFVPNVVQVANNDALLRRYKEEYYNGKYPPEGYPAVCKFTDTQSGTPVYAMTLINEHFMDTVIGQNQIQITCDSTSTRTGTWRELCRQFYQEAKKRIEESVYTVVGEDGKIKTVNCTLDTVVLTGGASKMDFIEPICREVFREPGVKIIRNSINPSHTVSNGLGWVSIADDNLESSKAAAKAEIKANGIGNVNTLKATVTNAIFEEVYKTTVTATNEWADAPDHTATVAELKDKINDTLNSAQVRNKLKSICEEKLASWKVDLSKVMEAAVNNQVGNLYSESVAGNLMIPQEMWQNLNAQLLMKEELDIETLINEMDFSTVVRKIILHVTRAFIWGIAIVLAPETFWLSLIGGLLVDLVAEVTIPDTSKNKPRHRNQRQKIAKQVEKKLNSQKTGIMKSFDEAFAEEAGSFDAVVDLVLDVAFKIVMLQRFEI